MEVVPEGGEALVSGPEYPNASPYAEVPAGTYTINVNATGTEETAISVPDVAVESGVTHSAFAVGTAAAGDLDVILTEDSAGGGTGFDLPETGGLFTAAFAGAAATLLAAGALLPLRSRLGGDAS